MLSGCQFPNNTQPATLLTQDQEQVIVSTNEPTKKDLTDFLLRSENAYCDLKKVDFIFWQKYSAPKYQQLYIQPEGNDVPLMRMLGKDGLNYLEINNIQSDFDKISNSPFKSEFSESIRLTNLSYSFLKKYLTTDSNLKSFEQFRDEAMPSLLGFRDTIPRIEQQLRNDYNDYVQLHPDLIAPENEGLLAVIDDSCTTSMPEMTQEALKGIPYDPNSQSLTKIDLNLWQPPEIQETPFISVNKESNVNRAKNNAYYVTGTTSSNCNYIGVEAVNISAGINDKYVLTDYKKGDTSFKYGIREDWNNLGSGETDYTFKASCADEQIVQDHVTMTLENAVLPVVATPTNYSNSDLSNNNYYTNSSGQEVHSPAYSASVPAGASARCNDGTYSFSQHRSGTCSGHGGVSTWL
jgi:hypothetical protein